MGNLVLFLRGGFRQGLSEGGIVENGVIAEAILPGGSPEQLSVNLSPGLDGFPLRGDQGDDADELSLPLSVGHVFRVLQQQLKPSPVVQALVKAIPGGVNSRLPVQRVHRDSGIVRQHEGADPASVVYDGIQSAKTKGVDVIIIDTAGRLHNKTNLMNELNKISRIVERELPNASREVLLVLDGTTGQNGLIQAKQFKEIAGVTAMAVTKLDGTAKGGIVIAVADALQIPAKFVGVGEQADDLMPFVARDFVEALI